MSKLGRVLNDSKWAKLGELIFIFITVFTFIKIFMPFAGENLVYKQAVIWLANILMLLLVWAGLKIRKQDLAHFGLSFSFPGWKMAGRGFLLSILAFIIAIAGFMVGTILMTNITGIPEGTADMSSYDYMKNNLPMFLLTLFGVYIVASFGEEVIYRGFLMNRIIEFGRNTKAMRITAVSLSSVIFGLVHYDWGIYGMVQTAFMGLGLGISYLVFGKKLWLTILAHGYMDTILMVQMYLNT